jgi:cysteinyl-tRNA synthetase
MSEIAHERQSGFFTVWTAINKTNRCYSTCVLRFYNTLTKKVDGFKPLRPREVTIYSCGPTVYNYPHIGNLRRYISDDILVRFLKLQGFRVKRVVNITDVGHLTQDDIERGEDKMLVAARREGKSPLAIAEHYTKAFIEDGQQLQFVEPDRYAKATDHIKEMLDLIQKLIEKGHAYEKNGSVYFDVGSFPAYGALSGNTLEHLREQVRADLKAEAFEEKKAPEDFALWKKAEPEHLLQWPSPWGQGYPGWHIECAAMIIKHLGSTIDIHTAGEDNIFPHNEDEIAEASSITGKRLANYWLHTRHLFVDGEKMAKSKGSFLRLTDLAKKNIHPMAFRYLVLGAHFSAHLNFTWPAMQAAQEGWQRIQEVAQLLRETQNNSSADKANTALTGTLQEMRLRFTEALEDNLNTPKALAIVSELVTLANTTIRGKAALADSAALLETLLFFDEALGLLPVATETELDAKKKTALIQQLKKRAALRAEKKFSESDAVREELLAEGFEIQDVPQGVRWAKKTSGQRGVIDANELK